MMDYLTLETAPIGEDCVQLGQDNYRELVKEEAKRYKELLINKFGDPPGNAQFKLKSFSHDFGTYHELCIMFDNENEEESNYAYIVENNLPEYWDDEIIMAEVI